MAPSAPTPDPHPALTSALLTRFSLPVSPHWLTTFLSTTRQPHPPLPALTSTAHFRILASDITTSLSTTSHPDTTFPPNISDTATKEVRLLGSVMVQVLDIQDVGISKGAQIEAIERVERGEEVRGREVIRTVPGLEEGGGGEGGEVANGVANVRGGGIGTMKRSQGPHKLVVQDAKGTKVVAFELESVPRVWIGEDGLGIGCKIVLHPGTVVRRGMVMLTPGSVRVLGGKVEPWDRLWREGRKARLLEGLGAGEG